MRVMSPEKCVELLDQHAEDITNSTAKLQIILEYFDELADGGEQRNFRNLSLFSSGIVMLCDEVIKGLWKCDLDDITEHIKLLSPDPAKIIKHVAYLESIGVRNETTDIELEG